MRAVCASEEAPQLGGPLLVVCQPGGSATTTLPIGPPTDSAQGTWSQCGGGDHLRTMLASEHKVIALTIIPGEAEAMFCLSKGPDQLELSFCFFRVVFFQTCVEYFSLVVFSYFEFKKSLFILSQRISFLQN